MYQVLLPWHLILLLNRKNAAIRLLALSPHDIELMATEIIVGQLPLMVASLRIEEINYLLTKIYESDS